MKKLMSDFKEFAMKGNVMDMAIGVIIGGAFGKIVSSLVDDIIMPFIGLLIGSSAFSDLKWVIKPAVYDAAGKVTEAENALRYGNFIQNVLDFLIIAFSIFIILRLMTRIKEKTALLNHKGEAEPKEVTEENKTELILTEIRDLMKENKDK